MPESQQHGVSWKCSQGVQRTVMVAGISISLSQRADCALLGCVNIPFRRFQWKSLYESIKDAVLSIAASKKPPADTGAGAGDDETQVVDAQGGASALSGKLRRRFSYPKGAAALSNDGTHADKFHPVGGDSNGGDYTGLGALPSKKEREAQESLIERMDGGDREAVGRSELAYAERFFRHLYGDAVAHVQLIYPFHIVSGGSAR